jgi:hypothetical protein
MVKKLFVVWSFILICIFAPFLGAEIMQSIRITDYLYLLHMADDSFSLANLLKNRWDFRSGGNANVKAQFQIDLFMMGTEDIPSGTGEVAGIPIVLMDIPRAYIKVRFPGFRATLGKTRVSWGDGFLFNAGDVIFGGMGLPSDITAAELRDETDLFASVYIPLGRFSFIETVFLPHPEAVVVYPGLYIPASIDMAKVSAGGRLYFEIKPIATACETGYLYKGKAGEHLPYISLHGHLLVDWNLSASCAIPQTDPVPDAVAKSCAISCGLFHMINLEGDSTLTLRLEAAVQPLRSWEEKAPDITGPGSVEQPIYGLYLYPEIVYAPDSTMSYQLRSIISPVDGSVIAFGGFNWNLYQGFTIGFMISGMAGDDDDQFGWGRDGDISFTIMAEYIFGE